MEATTATDDGTLVVGTILRQSESMILQDDRGTGAYLVTARRGWCFDQPDANGQNGLHELVADYVDGNKRDALRSARADFNNYARFVERCAAPNCEWCHGE